MADAPIDASGDREPGFDTVVTYQIGTNDDHSIDFANAAKPLRRQWERANVFGRKAERQKIEVLVRTRTFLRAAVLHRGRFRVAARKEGILHGRMETQVLRFVHGVETHTGRTTVNRLADMLSWLADQPGTDAELIERVAPMTMPDIFNLARADPSALRQFGRPQPPPRPDLYDIVRGKLYDRRSGTVELNPGQVGIYIAVADAMTGEHRFYGPVRDEATILDCVSVFCSVDVPGEVAAAE